VSYRPLCGLGVSVLAGATAPCSLPRGSQRGSAAPGSAPLKIPNPNHGLNAPGFG